MIKTFIEHIKNIDKYIMKLVFNGIKLSFILIIISLFLLILHIQNYSSHLFYDAGLILFKTAINFCVFFFVCGFVFDKLKKQII